MKRIGHILKRCVVILSIPAGVAAVMWLLLFNKAAPAAPIWAGGPMTKPPAISFWGGEVAFFAGSHDPLFVAWEDGTVVRRVPDPSSEIFAKVGLREDGSAYLYEGDKLVVFRSDPASIVKLMERASQLGWFTFCSAPPPQWNSGTMEDGPALDLTIRRDGEVRKWEYHGRFDWPNKLLYLQAHDRAVYREIQAFKTMWYPVLKAIGEIPLTEVGDYNGYPPLEDPARQ